MGSLIRCNSAPHAAASSSGWATSTSVRPSSGRKESTERKMQAAVPLDGMSNGGKAGGFFPSSRAEHLYWPVMHPLQAGIERLYALGPEARNVNGARGVFGDFRESLTRGEIRAAEKENGEWKVNVWVKQGILLGFRLGELMEMGCEDLSFVDKDTFPLRQFRIEDKVRVVPGGSSVREGAFVAP